MLETLEDVNWDRGTAQFLTDEEGSPLTGEDGEPLIADGTFPWEGIAGKVTPSGRFSIGGPKEVGYQVAAALENPESAGGKQVRKVVAAD